MSTLSNFQIVFKTNELDYSPSNLKMLMYNRYEHLRLLYSLFDQASTFFRYIEKLKCMNQKRALHIPNEASLLLQILYNSPIMNDNILYQL